MQNILAKTSSADRCSLDLLCGHRRTMDRQVIEIKCPGDIGVSRGAGQHSEYRPMKNYMFVHAVQLRASKITTQTHPSNHSCPDHYDLL